MYKYSKDSSQLLITIEGLDGSGKNSLAKKIAKYFKLDYIDTDFNANKGHSLISKSNFIDGINLATVQFFKSTSNLVKTRYSLSEKVYAEYYNRISLIDPIDLELAAIDKLVLIYIDIEYPKYLQIMKNYRFDETPFTEDEFNKQRNLFLKAYNESLILNKIFIKNDDIENVFNKSIEFINNVKNDKLNNINLNILKCDKCPLMIDSCKQVNPTYAKPILPNNSFIKNEIDYMFIGIAPGRGNNTPFSIKAFSHTSGSILHKILEEYEILDKTYFTNVIKCNTPKDGKFQDITVQNCINYLRAEILTINPKKIFVLGNDAKKYIENNLPNVLIGNEKRFVFIKHPSYLVYNKSEQALFDYKENIKNNILENGSIIR